MTIYKDTLSTGQNSLSLSESKQSEFVKLNNGLGSSLRNYNTSPLIIEVNKKDLIWESII